MGKIYWRKDENDLVSANPDMPLKQVAALVTALGYRDCTAEDVRCRRKRMKVTTPREDTVWPAAMVEKLKAYWAQSLPPARIADMIPYSRSAIWSKARRLELGPPPRRSPPGRSAEAATPAPVLRQPSVWTVGGAPKPPRSLATVGPVEGSLNIRMWDPAFGSRCCKWSTGEDESGFFLCAAPRLPGLPYCAPHSEVAYRPSPPRPPSAVKDSAPRAAKDDDGEPKPLDFEKAA